MKNMLFFLLGIFTLFTACSDDADSTPLTPTMLKVVSCDFVKEEMDWVKPVKEIGEPSFAIENETDFPTTYLNQWENSTLETSLFSLYTGSLPKAENLGELTIRVPTLHADGTFSDGGSEVPLVFGTTYEILDPRSRGQEEIVVPGHSTLKKITERTGSSCSITFYLVLVDVNTGQQYELRGAWYGLQISKETHTLLT